jgi:hypothetical protein
MPKHDGNGIEYKRAQLMQFLDYAAALIGLIGVILLFIFLNNQIPHKENF